MDAVTTRAPQGSDGVNPSTYWIDEALTAISAGENRNTGKPFQWGNATALLLTDEQVIARSLYELFPDQAIPADEFTRVLRLWRDKVIDTRAH
jgi:hypothetical protein